MCVCACVCLFFVSCVRMMSVVLSRAEGGVSRRPQGGSAMENKRRTGRGGGCRGARHVLFVCLGGGGVGLAFAGRPTWVAECCGDSLSSFGV